MNNLEHQPQRTMTTPFCANNWNDQLDDAIRNNDMTTMWNLVDSHVDQAEANRLLVDRIPRVAYQLNNRTYFNEMFLMPVVVHGGSDAIENPDCWRQAYHCIDDVLTTWLPKNTFKMVFHGLRSYDHVGTWQPAVIRRHLQRAIPMESGGKISYSFERIQLPEKAPRLGFASMVLTTKTGWPELPEANTLRDVRLQKVISYALHNTAESGIAAPVVLPPDRFKFALSDGFGLWLDQLYQFSRILGWGVSLRPHSADVVLVTLRLDDECEWTQFAIRKHQLGNDGLNDVISLLQAMAPNIEHPNDMPPVKKENAVLYI